MPKLGQLVIVQHFEPPPDEELAELLDRVYRRLLPDVLLTQCATGPTIDSQSETEGDDDASRPIRPS